mgnify:CR=1 FL=1
MPKRRASRVGAREQKLRDAAVTFGERALAGCEIEVPHAPEALGIAERFDVFSAAVKALSPLVERARVVVAEVFEVKES